MELALSQRDGDALDAVYSFVRGGYWLVIAHDPAAWNEMTAGLRVGAPSRVVVSRRAGQFSVACADLARQSIRPESLAEEVAAVAEQLVAVRVPAAQIRTDAVARMVRALTAHRPVVLFVPRDVELGQLTTAVRATAFSGRDRGATVTGIPGGRWNSPPVLPVANPSTFRIEDMLREFQDWTRHKTLERELTRRLPPSELSTPASWDPSLHSVPRSSASSDVPESVPTSSWLDSERGEEPSAVRYVNTLVARPGDDEGLNRAFPLGRDRAYDLLVNIGAYAPESLLSERDALWPTEPLPGGALVLRAVLTMEGMLPRVARLTLPSRDDSFACDCPESEHLRACAREPWVRFDVRTPDERVLWTGELAIYYGVVAVHAQQLFLPIGDRTADGMHARLRYRLTRTFADLGPLAERTASVLVTDGGSRALVNGATFAHNPVWISTNAADNAVRAARQLLHDLHFRAGRTTLNPDCGKDLPEFASDLATLARQGAVLYDRLFRDNEVFDTLPDLIRHEAAARARPAVLTVADATISEPDRRHPVPWSLVYDLPMPQDPAGEFRECKSVRRFGPGGGGEPVPPHCPEADHSGNVLCPFGFWGLAAVVEQPAGSGELVWNVLNDPSPARIELAVDAGLDRELTDRHITGLDSALPGMVHPEIVDTPHRLARMLAQETMDVAHLYCHGGYHRVATNALPSPVLRFGTKMVDPVMVANWRRDGGWPRPHWPSRKPLVVLNGCHTAELTSATLSNFVEAFTNRAGAAGVIGTEVSVEQGMASRVMEQLLTLLVKGAAAGEALRTVRWRMINQGNVMGLAYTLYSVAGLRLRPPGRRSRWKETVS